MNNINELINNPVIEPTQDIFSILVKIDEKTDKHKKEAEPILAGSMTAYEAFKNGCEKAIANFIKLGQEGHITQKIMEIPPIKSETTLQAEILIKALLANFDSVKFIKHRSQYFAIYQGQKYDLKKILEDVNFNQIVLTKEELAAYEILLSQGILAESPMLNAVAINRPPYSTLTYAEKAAINIYTGDGFHMMNSLLRGDIKGAIEEYYTPLPLHQRAITELALKETLLHICVAVSGLNKLPDFTPEPNPDGTIPKFVYRAETDIPKSVLKARKQAVAEGGKVLWEMGFLSTAHTKPDEGFFAGADVGIMIKNIKGKNIVGLSQFPGEREILFPPTQMQWRYHKEVIKDIVLKTKIDLFIAKPIQANHKVVTIEDNLAKKAWIAKTQRVAKDHFLV